MSPPQSLKALAEQVVARGQRAERHGRTPRRNAGGERLLDSQGEQLLALELQERARRAIDTEALEAVLVDAKTALDAGALTSDEAAAVAAWVGRCGRWVDLRRQGGATAAAVEEMGGRPIRELLDLAGWIRIRSRVLGAEVAIAGDGVELPDATTDAVYRLHELPQLIGLQPHQLRAIHAVRRAVDGELVG